MSKTITISDETFDALKEQIDEMERKDEYPMAVLSLKGSPRLVLNIPDGFLSKGYKGYIFSISPEGWVGKKMRKGTVTGNFYSTDDDEKQVFPVVE